MVQKVIDVVGVSGTSFAAAAKNAVQEAGKTVRGMKWGRVSEFEVSLDNRKVTEYRATVRIYFDLEQDPERLRADLDGIGCPRAKIW